MKKLFSLGIGRLRDEEGIDWWGLTSMSIVRETEAVLIFLRMIPKIGGSAEIWATRPGWPASAVSLLLNRPFMSFSQERSARLDEIVGLLAGPQDWPSAAEGFWKTAEPEALRRFFGRKSSSGVAGRTL